MEVHRQLGYGFLENVYQESLALELSERRIPFQREVMLDVYYKGTKLDCSYRVDFLCYGSLVVELKAVDKVIPRHEAQIIHYLKATRMEKGLLFNFGGGSLYFRRYVLTVG